MSLLTQEQIKQLLINGSPENRDKDHVPVVKLVLPDAQACWLLTWIDPDNVDVAFGLCDVGLGYPVMASASITKLEKIKGSAGFHVEIDRTFQRKHTINVYAKVAKQLGFISESEKIICKILSHDTQKYQKPSLE